MGEKEFMITVLSVFSTDFRDCLRFSPALLSIAKTKPTITVSFSLFVADRVSEQCQRLMIWQLENSNNDVKESYAELCPL